MTLPKPGDLLLVETTDDVLISVGSYGVVNRYARGWERQWTRGSGVEATFNFYPPWLSDRGCEYVSASGGPVRLIPLRRIESTKEKKNVIFKTGDPLSSKEVKLKVRIFKVYLGGK